MREASALAARDDKVEGMTTTEAQSLRWWGEHELENGWSGRWQIGPFRLTARREALEWRLSWQREGDIQSSAQEIHVGPEEIGETGTLLRIVSGSDAQRLEIAPRLADRPVVARPETPFRLLPASRIQLYISTPAWIRVVVDHPPQEILDLATWRLSDTWFGSSTGDGELCYSILTSARLHVENLPVVPHRVVTQVVLENRGHRALSLERLNIPVPHLSLYANAEDHLWTQTVFVKSDREGHVAEVDLGKGPPEEAGETELLAPPRQAVQRNRLVRAIGGFML